MDAKNSPMQNVTHSTGVVAPHPPDAPDAPTVPTVNAPEIPPKPDALAVALSNIPDEFKRLPQWVCWRFQWCEPTDTNPGRWTKPPYRPTGYPASHSKPASWASFEKVRAAYERGGFDGIGFVVTESDPFCGIDLDGWRDPVTGQLNDRARDVVARLDSYTEISPSGCGVRIWVKGKLPPGERSKGSKADGVEAYDTVRFLTLTGQRLEGTPDTVNERGDALAQFHADYLATPEPKQKPQREEAPDIQPLALDDVTLLEKARAASNGAKFAALWNGDTGNDASVADLSLCSLLAFWTGRDPARMDALFRRSALWREKWDVPHRADGATYGQMTIEEAISRPGDTYTGKKGNDAVSTLGAKATPHELDGQSDGEANKKPRASKLVRIGELHKEPPTPWLIQRILMGGTLSLFTADSGSYKSFLALHIAYCVAHGIPFFGRGVKSGPVVYVAGEGAGGVRARSIAWDKHHERTSPDNLFVWKGAVQIANAGEVAAFLLDLEESEVSPSLIIFDTLNRCAIGLEENSAKDMGLFIAGLEHIKGATGAHVSVVHHNNAMGKSRGSTALPGAFDTRFSAEREGNRIVVRCQKQKDGAEEFEPFALESRAVDIGEVDEYGDPATSLILEPSDKKPTSEAKVPKIGAKERKKREVLAILAKLHEEATEGGKVLKTDWEEAVVPAICVRSTFYDYIREMEAEKRWYWWKGDCRLEENPENPENPENVKTDKTDMAETRKSGKSGKSGFPLGNRTDRTNRTEPKATPKKRAAKDSEPYGAPLSVATGEEIEEGTL